MLISSNCLAADYGPYQADFINNYDGDTVHLLIDLYPGLVTSQKVRIKNIDTPEIRGSCPEERSLAIIARDTLRETLRAAESISVVVHGMGKYGRPIVSLRANMEDVGQMLIDLGLARRYDGGARQSWCP